MLLRWIAPGLLLSLLLAPILSYGQIIDTIAGNAINNNRPALNTPLVRPQGLVFDNSGNLIIADRGQFVIRQVSGGNSTVIAGGGTRFDDALPIPPQTAALDYPVFLAVGTDGSIYFSDYNDYRVRRITPSGDVVNVAGNGDYGYSGDGGSATQARLSNPTGLALDRSRNILYISDTWNFVIRSVNLSTGIIQTVAGNGFDGYSGDGGPASLAQLYEPWGLAVDSGGNLYIGDIEPATSAGIVRRVSVDGFISTLVPASAGLESATALAFSPSGDLYVSDYEGNRVVRVGVGGSLTTVAGGVAGSGLPEENVSATATELLDPIGIVFDTAGNLYISEEGWDIVRRVDAQTGLIRTYAGTLDVLDEGPALSAPLSTPRSIAVDGAGRVFIADSFHNRIRRIDLDGTIRTVFGTGEADSTSTATWLPSGVSLDAAGNIYYSEPVISAVSWRHEASGDLFFLAGQRDQFGYSGDGGISYEAMLNGPTAVLADSSGVVYIADTGNHCIRKVDLNFIITRVAGVCTEAGYSGDGGPALQARLDSPEGLAFDSNGNLLIADTGNSVVRRVDLSTGTISLVAGIPGVFDYSGDGGNPLEAAFGSPISLAVDPTTGSIFVADVYWSVVRIIIGTKIFTLAGVGEDGFFGDGLISTSAYLNQPESIALDPAGNLYIADTQNNRVRKISLENLEPPSLVVLPSSLNFHIQQEGVAPPGQFLLIFNSGFGLLDWEYDLRVPPEGSGTFSGGSWLFLSDFDGGTAPSLPGVFVDPSFVTSEGVHQGQVVVVSPGSANPVAVVPITLTVDPPIEPFLAASDAYLEFDAVQGASAPSPQFLSITNRGSGTLNWEANSTTFLGGPWLSLSQTAGTAQSSGDAASIKVSVNQAGLDPGFYVGLITLKNANSGALTDVYVGLSVGAPAPTILTAPSSFVFTTVQGSNFIPPQLMRVLNTGQGTMIWQVESSVSSGNWLRVSPSSGMSDATNPAAAPAVTLSVDPSGLAPGVYGGILTIRSNGARNTPQNASVTLRVLPSGSPPIAEVQPSGLLFSAVTNTSPQTQQATLQTTGGGRLDFNVGVRTQSGGGWLTASPAAGSLSNSTDRPQVRVQAAPGTLPAGTYRGAVTVSFSDGTSREIAVAMIVRDPDVVTQGFGGAQVGCAPSQQVLLSTGLGNNFSLPTGWPKTIIASLNSNCGEPIDDSTVTASFNNGDDTLLLNNQGGGVYSNDWIPSAAGGVGGVQVTLRSVNSNYPQALLQLVGALGADSTHPVVDSGGIVNGASFAANQPVSPGGIVSIFGRHLAAAGPCFGGNCAGSTPLPKSLGGISVRIGGLEAPLFYAGDGQINAQVPGELTGVTSADVIVTARGLVSAPRNIQLGSSQPGIFQFGGNRGAVLISNTDLLAADVGSVPGRNTRPAHRGEFITIYCTGLGAVNDPPPSGSPATASPLSRTLVPVSVTIGGVAVTNVGFAGLSPGFVGLYQVDVPVPNNVAPGSAVPVKITQNGVDSNEVSIAID